MAVASGSQMVTAAVRPARDMEGQTVRRCPQVYYLWGENCNTLTERGEGEGDRSMRADGEGKSQGDEEPPALQRGGPLGGMEGDGFGSSPGDEMADGDRLEGGTGLPPPTCTETGKGGGK